MAITKSNANANKHDALIEKLVNKAAHYLPDQAPIHAFVHHNTLHAYEGLHFKDAVREASEKFNAEPFMAESAYGEALEQGRIRVSDIEHVLEKEVQELEVPLFKGAPTRKAFLMWRFTHLFNVPSQQSLAWWLYEKDLLNIPHRLAGSSTFDSQSPIYQKTTRSFEKGTLKKLWELLENEAPVKQEVMNYSRARHFFLREKNMDTDSWTVPLLIKLCGAYLDQGVANKAIPFRDQGFLRAFWHYIDTPALFEEPWLKHLKKRNRDNQLSSLNATQVIALVLSQYFGIAEKYWYETMCDTLQVLKGWAGMFRQFELYPHKAPIHHIPATLLDFLAVQLLLDFSAAKTAEKQTGLSLATFKKKLESSGPKKEKTEKDTTMIYEAFVSAQAFELTEALLNNPPYARIWLQEHHRFNAFERRYLLHLAYERRHRQHILDAMNAHRQVEKSHTGSETTDIAFQALFCMDEREESTRRYLEEISPDAQTFGCPGFFGVPMEYQGFDETASRPLCPVNITPKHYVKEEAVEADRVRAYKNIRKKHGGLLSFLYKKSEVMPIINIILPLISAPFYTISLISHSIAPHFTNVLLHKLTSYHQKKPETTLALFRSSDEVVDEKNRYLGFSFAESAEIVAKIFNSIGLNSEFAPLIVIVGHGSSSLNNPHEAAHDCGATGGGRGGPNARAFAMMANHPQVRKILSQQHHIDLPDTVHVVGAYHNTADDSMAYYDTKQIPSALKHSFKRIQHTLKKSCMMSARERCRRFEDAPLDISLKSALDVAKRHSTDLAQPRPEYGHATNAVCVIGSRANTKGLYFDRRAFLISYEPSKDKTGKILSAIIQAAAPVGAGINLEYYFSFVDPTVYGCGTKLPHNISGLVGVMNGHASDLRTGLPWQMVEIHEPVRLLTIVEATPEQLLSIAEESPVVKQLVVNQWIQLVSWHPVTGKLSYFTGESFVEHQTEIDKFPIAKASTDVFRGTREHLGCAHIIEEK